jgi:hypothetical protein
MHGFLIPYLATFWIVGFQVDGLKIALLLFCVIQTTLEIFRDIQIDKSTLGIADSRL